MVDFATFNELPIEMQRETLQRLRSEVGISGLVSLWGISTSKLYSLIHQLDLPVSNRGRRKKPRPETTEHPADNVQAQDKESIGISGSKFSFSMTVEGTGSELTSKLKPLLNTMAATGIRLKINIVAEEV